ncbi:MAG: hypothetical protein AB7R00_13765 [Kofleriaceae bacterium]
MGAVLAIRRLLMLAMVVHGSAGCMPVHGRPADPAVAQVSPSAPFEYRYAQFVAVRGIRLDRDYQGFSLQHSMYSSQYLLLANGQKVFDVVDLDVYVAPSSALGRDIEQKRRARARNRRIMIIGITGIAVGAALFGLGAVALANDRNGLAIAPISLGAVALFGGLGYWTFVKRSDADGSIQDNMLDRYNASLGESLQLCISGLYVLSCDAAPNLTRPVPAVPPPSPVLPPPPAAAPP